MCGLFLFITDSNTADYADDTTPYLCNRNLNEITKNLRLSLLSMSGLKITISKAILEKS